MIETPASRGGQRRFAFRLAIVFGGAAMVWGATTNALSNITRAGAPDLVLRVAPRDAGAMVWLANQQIEQLDQPAVRQQVEGLARVALQSEILNAKAFRLLGYVADASGQTAAAHRYIDDAQRLSRREIGTQYWLIQEAVSRNDVPAALEHYDIALRTSSAARDTLYPILAQALSDPRIRGPFARLLRQDPPWMASFLSFAIRSGSDPAAIAGLLKASGGTPRTDAYRGLEGALLLRLEDAGEIRALRTYFETLPQVSRQQEWNISIGSDTGLAPVTWRLYPSSDRMAVIEKPQGGVPLLHLWGSGAYGTVARKMLFLPPGFYYLRARIRYLQRAADGSVALALDCLNGKKAVPFWNQDIGRNGQVAALVDVPAACEAVYLRAGVAGGASGQIEAQLSELSLARK